MSLVTAIRIPELGRTGKTLRHDPAAPDETRVLVVDDEPDIVDEVSSYLRAKGFLCDTAFDGEEAIRKIQNTPEIAIVVTDIRMPRLDGLEMMRRLHRLKERDLAVIVVTGHVGTREANEARELGALDLLTKPVSLPKLLKCVRRATKLVRSRGKDRRGREPDFQTADPLSQR